MEPGIKELFSIIFMHIYFFIMFHPCTMSFYWDLDHSRPASDLKRMFSDP